MSHPLNDLTDSLDDKVGGVPVWVIGGGIGVLIGVGYWLWKRNSGGITPETYDPSADSGDAGSDEPSNSDLGLPDGPVGDWLADNPGSTAFPVGGAANPSPITNGQWARQVIDGLIGLGNDPTLVTNAITKYIAGQGLSTSEKSVVNIALTRFGSTPEGSLQIKDATVAAGQRGYGWYQVKKGDSAKSISQVYKIPVATFFIYNGGSALKPGQWVKVRANSNPVVGYGGR